MKWRILRTTSAFALCVLIAGSICISMQLQPQPPTTPSAVGLKSGRAKVLPLELDTPPFKFLAADSKRVICKAVSSAGLSCTKEGESFTPPMVGAILSQGGMRYLIACTEGDSSCVRPKYGVAAVTIEGRTIRFTDWNVVTTDRKTGRKLDSAPAFFTLLTWLNDGPTSGSDHDLDSTKGALNNAPNQEGPPVLPREWIYTTGGQPATIRVEGDRIYEQTSFSEEGLYTEEAFCETKRSEDGWSGHCTYKFVFLFNNRAIPLHCSLQTAETLTSVAPRRIEGKSQAIDFSRITPTTCPVAGSDWQDFALIPKL